MSYWNFEEEIEEIENTSSKEARRSLEDKLTKKRLDALEEVMEKKIRIKVISCKGVFGHMRWVKEGIFEGIEDGLVRLKNYDEGISIDKIYSIREL